MARAGGRPAPRARASLPDPVLHVAEAVLGDVQPALGLAYPRLRVAPGPLRTALGGLPRLAPPHRSDGRDTGEDPGHDRAPAHRVPARGLTDLFGGFLPAGLDLTRLRLHVSLVRQRARGLAQFLAGRGDVIAQVVDRDAGVGACLLVTHGVPSS